MSVEAAVHAAESQLEHRAEADRGGFGPAGHRSLASGGWGDGSGGWRLSFGGGLTNSYSVPGNLLGGYHTLQVFSKALLSGSLL